MKLVSKLTALLAAIALMVACGEENTDTPSPAADNTKREIVYAVGADEHRTELKSDTEWDALLDTFCDYAQQGQSVTFYNMSTQPLHAAKEVGTIKDATTFSTSNRAEMKQWMKDMEKQGKTVNVTYDSNNGTWNGTAYANAPHQEEPGSGYTGTLVLTQMPALTQPYIPAHVVALQVSPDSVLLLSRNGCLTSEVTDLLPNAQLGDEVTLTGILQTYTDLNEAPFMMLDITERNIGSLVGTWHLSCLVSTTPGNGSNYILSSEVYIPEFDGETISYSFEPDGTATRTTSGENNGTATGTWSLTDDGMFCCDLLPVGGGCWNINWLSHSTMIISRHGITPYDENTYYQIQFDINGLQLFK